MRQFIVPILLLCTLQATAQCCCTDIRLFVTLGERTPWNTEREYVIGEHANSYTTNTDSTDQEFLFTMDASCGLMERLVSITRRATGQRMELRLLFVGYDGRHPDFRVPFTPGVFDIDLERIINCGNELALVKENTDGGGPGGMGTVDCGGWRIGWKRRDGQITYQLPALRSGIFGPGAAENDGSGRAYCSGGQDGFQEELNALFQQQHVARDLWRTTYEGIAYVSAEGRIHARIDQNQTNKVYALESALMDCTGWKPARVPDATEPDGFRNVASMVRFEMALGE